MKSFFTNNFTRDVITLTSFYNKPKEKGNSLSTLILAYGQVFTFFLLALLIVLTITGVLLDPVLCQPETPIEEVLKRIDTFDKEVKSLIQGFIPHVTPDAPIEEILKRIDSFTPEVKSMIQGFIPHVTPNATIEEMITRIDSFTPEVKSMIQKFIPRDEPDALTEEMITRIESFTPEMKALLSKFLPKA